MEERLYSMRPCKKCLFVPTISGISHCPKCGFPYKYHYTDEEKKQFHQYFKDLEIKAKIEEQKRWHC